MAFNTKTPTPTTAPVPVQPEGLATNQRAVPVPWWWGQRKIAARWITGVKNQIAIEATGTNVNKK